MAWTHLHALYHDLQNQGEAPTYRQLRLTRHTARRTRRCDLCGRAIPAGTRYEASVFVQDGEFGTASQCGRCEE